MLELKNINVRLGDDTNLERIILKDLNLNILDGEFIVIMGGNGAGKSTLFNIISGMFEATSGEILIDGKDIKTQTKNTTSSLVSKVMQDPKAGTIENMTIFENLAFALWRGKNRRFLLFSNKDRKQMFIQRLSLLNMGLENRLDELVSNLSGGQRQAFSLIMATLSDSKLLLLDEITAALDPSIAKIVMEIADNIIKCENRTCIMITHNMADAIKYGSRLLILKDGKFVKEYKGYEKQNLTSDRLMANFES